MAPRTVGRARRLCLLRHLAGVPAAASIGSPASRPPCCTTATSSSRRPTGSPTSTPATALTTDHRFRIASHSKTFTATAVVRLAERGPCCASTTRWGSGCPSWPAAPIAAVTLRELLAHGGGVVRDGRDGDHWQLARPFPDAATLRADRRRRRRRARPATSASSTPTSASRCSAPSSRRPPASLRRPRARRRCSSRSGLAATTPDIDPALSPTITPPGTRRSPTPPSASRSTTSPPARWRPRPGSPRRPTTSCAGRPPTSSATSGSCPTTPSGRCSTPSGRSRASGEYGLGFAGRRPRRAAGARPRRRLPRLHHPHLVRSRRPPRRRRADQRRRRPAPDAGDVAVRLVELAAGLDDGRRSAGRRPGAATPVASPRCGAVRRRRPRRPAVRARPVRSTTRSPSRQRLEVVDDDTLRIADGPGYGSPGERYVYERDRTGASSPCAAAAARWPCPTTASGPALGARPTGSAWAPGARVPRRIGHASMDGCRRGVPAAVTADADRPAGRAPALGGRAWAWPLVPAGLVAAAWRWSRSRLRWRGSDLPAHFFRVALVERDGFQIWNNQWFGGHHTLGYGALFPVLGAAIGIWTVAVLSAGVVGAARRRPDHAAGSAAAASPASLWFAAGTVTNVADRPAAVRPRPRHRARRARRGPAPAPGAHRPAHRRHGGGQPGRQRLPRHRLRRMGVGRSGAASARRFAAARRRGAGCRCSSSPCCTRRAARSRSAGWRSSARWPSRCLGVAVLVPAQYRLVRAAAVDVRARVDRRLPRPDAARRQPHPLRHVRRRRRAARARAAAPGALVVAARPALLFWQWSPAFDAIFRSGRRSVDRAGLLRPAAAATSARSAPRTAARRSCRRRATGRPRSWPPASRSPAAGSASSTSASTACSTSDELTAAELPRLAARRGRRPRGARRRAARRRRRAGGGADRAGPAVPPAGVVGPPLAGVGGRRLARAGRRPGRASSTSTPTPSTSTSPARATSRCGSAARRSGAPTRPSASRRPTTAGSCCATPPLGPLEVFLDDSDLVKGDDDPCSTP